MGDIYQAIEVRINNLNSLLLEHLTPLLRKQIEHAVELHRAALERPNPYLEDLDVLYDQLQKHWTKVYGNLVSKASLSQDIIMLHQFLVGKLLEDYTNQPYKIGKWVIDLAKCINEYHTGARDGSNMDIAYSVHFIYPLEEMMLSVDYIANKFRALAARLGCQGSDIQPLIDNEDWPNLAAALTNDRDLAEKLFQQQPFNTNAFDKSTYCKVLKGMDKIKDRYFERLMYQSAFTVSPHARKTN